MNTPVPSPLAPSSINGGNPNLSSLEKPMSYRDLDTKFPRVKDSPDPNRLSPPLLDGLESDTPALESPAISTSVCEAIPPNESLNTPYPDLTDRPQHRLIQNLLQKHGAKSPIVSPAVSQNSINTAPLATTPTGSFKPTTMDSFEDLENSSAPDSGSGIDDSSDLVFSPDTTGTESPLTPGSDVDEYFPYVSRSGGESQPGTDRRSSDLELSHDSGTLDTPYPRSHGLEDPMDRLSDISSSRVSAKSPDLDNLDLSELEDKQPDFPPLSRTLSRKSSFLLEIEDGVISLKSLTPLSQGDGSMVYSMSST